jgi:hypothetical protein
LLSAAAGFLLGLFFGPEYESCSFPRKCEAVSKLEDITTQKTILFLVSDGCCNKSNILEFVTSIQVYSTNVIKLEAFILFCDSILQAWFLIILYCRVMNPVACTIKVVNIKPSLATTVQDIYYVLIFIFNF